MNAAEEPSRPPGAARVVIERRIEWSDTDASGHHHHAAILRMAEAAESELMDGLGLAGMYGRLPRVHVEADFAAPLGFRALVALELWVGTLGRTSVTWDFAAHHDGRRVATGRVVAVRLSGPGGRPEPWTAAERVRLLGEDRDG